LNEKNDEINKEEPSCGQIFQYITSNYSFFHRYFDSISKEETGMYKFNFITFEFQTLQLIYYGVLSLKTKNIE